MQTVTVWSFRLNGWVNYAFPDASRDPVFKSLNGAVAFGDKKNASDYASKKPHQSPPAELHAGPREWVKFPQVFDSSEGHSRTFFR